MSVNSPKITIALDGPAGSGKSTVAKLLAQRNNLMYIDTGAMYRAMTWLVLRLGLDTETQVERILEEVRKSQLRLDQPPSMGDPVQVMLNDQNITDRIRSAEINDKVSAVSAIPGIRTYLVSLQQRMGEAGNAILDGRDIGTVVFPKADLKIFLEASIQERAKRRYAEEQAQGSSKSLAEVEESIAKRDFLDRTRAVSPLIKAEDAIEINTDNLSIDQVVTRIEAEILRVKARES